MLIGLVGLAGLPFPAQADGIGVSRSSLPHLLEPFADRGVLQFTLEYQLEQSRDVRHDSGEVAPNPRQERLELQTGTLRILYGVHERINLGILVPFLSVRSDQTQGGAYLLENVGFGDILFSGEIALFLDPLVTVETGVQVPSGDIDREDDFGQRISDRLSLGSGTTDLIVGGRLQFSHIEGQPFHVLGRLRHRFNSGVNKWGYRFGESTDLSLHAYVSDLGQVQLGVRLDVEHSEPDRRDETRVRGTGRGIAYLGPTIGWSASDQVALGVFARFPVFLDLSDDQVVSPVMVGLSGSYELGRSRDRANKVGGP